jgi:hypothetical protein
MAHPVMRFEVLGKDGDALRNFYGKLLLLTLLTLAPLAALGQEHAADTPITQALLPLPDPLRHGATVVLDSAPGKRTVLRKGTNQLICRADTSAPGFEVYCHHTDMDAFFTRVEQLAITVKSEAELRDALGTEIKSGKLKMPVGGTVNYALTGRSAHDALPIMGIFVPGATSESTGLSIEPNNYRPWLMWAGTPVAHVMVPGK